MKFEVTQQHIDKGIPYQGHYCSGKGCVLALAIHDALKKRHKPRKRIDVGVLQITINGKVYRHTTETRQIVCDFDCGLINKVKPGIYEIED